MLDLLEAGEKAEDPCDADVRHQLRSHAEILESAARLFRDHDVRRAGGHEHDGALDVRHGFPDGEVKSGRTLVVVGASGQWLNRELLPQTREEPGDENVVRACELAADLGDLSRRFSLGENDFGKSDAAQAVEIERVVLTGHRCAG